LKFPKRITAALVAATLAAPLAAHDPAWSRIPAGDAQTRYIALLDLAWTLAARCRAELLAPTAAPPTIPSHYSPELRAVMLAAYRDVNAPSDACPRFRSAALHLIEAEEPFLRQFNDAVANGAEVNEDVVEEMERQEYLVEVTLEQLRLAEADAELEVRVAPELPEVEALGPMELPELREVRVLQEPPAPQESRQ